MTTFFLIACVIALLASVVFPMFSFGLITGIVLTLWATIGLRHHNARKATPQ